MIDQPVQIRPPARDLILDAFRNQLIPDGYGLRVGVRGGGCGASWLLGFDQPGPADEVYNVDAVRVIIDRKHLLYVLGAEIDYQTTAEGTGFTVVKPGL